MPPLPCPDGIRIDSEPNSDSTFTLGQEIDIRVLWSYNVLVTSTP